MDLREHYQRDGEGDWLVSAPCMAGGAWRAARQLLACGGQAAERAGGRRASTCVALRSICSPPPPSLPPTPHNLALPPDQPTKKGVALGPDEWEQLVAAAPAISQALQAGGGGGGGGGGAASGAASGAAAPASAAVLAASAAAAPAASGAAVAAAPAEGSVELSASRRAEISTFKGTTYVGLREFYQKVRGGRRRGEKEERKREKIDWRCGRRTLRPPLG